MDRKRERGLWIGATSVLVLILAVILLAPVVFAQSSAGRSTQDYIREIEAAFRIIQARYVDEVDGDVLFQGAMEGLFGALDDPYSLYLSDEILEQMTDTTEGIYGGVGLYISRDRFDPDSPFGRLPYVKVVSPIENTPSWRAGINAGDYIYAIDGESAEGYDTQDVSDRLRGTPGTQVEVTILRGGSFTFDVTLTRAQIEIPTVRTEIINGNVGYLRIIEFTPYTPPRVQEALEEFLALGIESLIIDVRSNPGGLLEAVVQIGDMFFSGGVVVSTQYRERSQNQVHRAAPGRVVPTDIPIAILIDQGSASASEILAGALKDRDRAVVIGQTSYGKASVQQMYPFGQAAIKLTTGRYFTPDGNDIDEIGIDPDIVVEEPELTPEEARSYALILQENRVGTFIDEHSTPSEREVQRFIDDLRDEGIDPGERILRLMVKRESDRRLNAPPVVDLEFDSVLLRALDYLETGE